MNTASLDAAVARLRAGGLVIIPTETVYGLAADALDPRAVHHVFEAKGRPPGNPLIVHCADEEMAKTVAGEWPTSASRLAGRFWPGPLTLVLPVAESIPIQVTAGLGSVAIRVPDHPVTLELIRAFGGPIVAPSANPSGAVSVTEVEHLRPFADQEDLPVLDGGPCKIGVESTVLSLLNGSPRVLRPGAITPEQFGPTLGSAPPVAPVGDADADSLSPGRAYRHYAPRTRAEPFLRDKLPMHCRESTAILSIGSAVRTEREAWQEVLPNDPSGYTATLYSAMHRADAVGAEIILIEWPGFPGPEWDVVRDRLRRATAP